MSIVKVKEIIEKEKGLSTSDGIRLFDFLKQKYFELEENEKLEIDFEGITKTISAFLNASVGQLYSLDKDPEKVTNKIKLINIPPGREERFDEVISNAIETYMNKNQSN
jgi:hypothetical protein